MTFRTMLARLVFGIVIAAAVGWLAVYSEATLHAGLIALGLLSLAIFLPRIVRGMRAAGSGAVSEVGEAWIEANDLADQLNREGAPIIVDVRGPDEFRGALGHLQGARNTPLNELQHRISELAEFKEREVMLVCRTQMRSAKAAALLRAAGFDVYVLHGGMEQWNRLGLPVEARAASPPRQ
jgi:rhodanese-related sulfurtransferase